MGVAVEESLVDSFPRENANGSLEERAEVELCNISDECFAIPPGYRKLYGSGRGSADQEEELLQMAIQQSLMTTDSQTQQLELEDSSKGHDGEEVCVHV